MLPRWADEPVAILASGASLSREQVAEIEESPCRVIVINRTWQRAPWADLLYACDRSFWDRYADETRRGFARQRWTQDESAAQLYGLELIRSVDAPGLSREPGVINQGGNSGYQAIGLAWQTGARRIFLFGFDMHGEHWHGPHEESVAGHLTIKLDFASWIPRFDRLAADLASDGVDVINCTPGSALRCFRGGSLRGD